MYELILDGSTRTMWYLKAAAIGMGVLFVLGLALFLLFRKRAGSLVKLTAFVGIGAIGAALFLAPLSPYAHYRRRLEPSIKAGEELFRRYEDYQQANGHYPESVDTVYFDDLAAFD